MTGRKLWVILLSAVCVLSTAACGTPSSETAGQTEGVTAEEETEKTAQEADTQSAEGAQNAESAEEEGSKGEEMATDEAEEAAQEKTDDNVITWYMDDEGMKSDELGMMIRKDNGIMDVELSQHMWVYGDGRGTQLNFTCSYYDGSLNNYIVQNPGYKKGTWGEYEYAYWEDEYTGGSINVAFVGNGVVLEGSFFSGDLLESENLNEYLTRANVQICDEFSQDYFAYLTADGLYSPALGITVTYNEEGTSEYGKNEIDSQYVGCSNYNSYAGDKRLDIRSDSYQNNTSYYGMGDAESAQEALDIYVASCMESGESSSIEYTELEGTVETMIAGYPYLGKGLSSRWKDDVSGSTYYEWLFCSDDIAWTIWIDTTEETYESCLSVIETMP